MEVVTSFRPLLAVLVSLIAGCLILLTGERSRNLRETWTILASVAKFIIVTSMIPIVLQGKVVEYTRGLNEHAQTRYFFCFAIAISATMGIAFAGNLLTLFVFYEVLTMATYPLVAHKETPEAIKGGRKYLTYTLTAGVVT